MESRNLQSRPLLQEITSTFRSAADFLRAKGYGQYSYVAKSTIPVTSPTTLVFDSDSDGQVIMPENHWLNLLKPRSDASSSFLHNIQIDRSSPAIYAKIRPYWSGFGQYAAFAVFGRNPVEDNAETAAFNLLADSFHQMMWPLCESFLKTSQATPLTSREREVMRWTADGKTSNEVAEILGISERTVNYHVNQVLDKYQWRNKIQAAVHATALGLLY